MQSTKHKEQSTASNAGTVLETRTPPVLPAVPGGWTTRSIDLGPLRVELTLPADPDAFLDDPQVLADHDRDGAMPYWPYLWPAALAMSRRMLAADWSAGMQALEIGAGVGLVGLAAAARGLDVTVSDYRQTAVDLAVHNARRNGLANVRGRLLDWRASLADVRFPLILGCDVLYETRNHAPILNLLETMLASGGTVWIGDAGRQHAAAFIDQARQRGFTVTLSDAGGQPLAAPQVGAFQLLELQR
ncbi:MAG TPA: methyltransferase domain-containing protein [Planctomycetaceae bacterium]|nr:methyltransferase domain-containing protein [Planctomycetaceae bacterium]